MEIVWNWFGGICVNSGKILLEPYMMRVPPQSFTALKLNFRNDRSWAVIEQPSGAIATASNGEMLMRLSEKEAWKIATEMAMQLHVPPQRYSGHVISLFH